jgi:hypothetical protein
MAQDPQLLKHKEWLGLLQPVGLVVSPPALIKAQAVVNTAVIDLQQTLQDLIITEEGKNPYFQFTDLMTEILGWELTDLDNSEEILEQYELNLIDYGEIIKPSYIVPDPNSDRAAPLCDRALC